MRVAVINWFVDFISSFFGKSVPKTVVQKVIPPQMNLLEITYPLMINFALFTMAWIFSIFKGNVNACDYVWGPSYIITAVYHLLSNENKNKFSLEKLTFTTILIFHSIRLSAYLFYRSNTEDKRYNWFRQKIGSNFTWLSFFVIFLPQLVAQNIVSVVLMAFNRSNATINQPLYWNGIVMMLCGTIFETIADTQLLNFKRSRKNANAILESGLWGVSRHPNYFGESVFWWGAYVCNLSVNVYWTVISPVVMTVLLYFVSGKIPLESFMIEKYGKDYKVYQKRVSGFLPWIPKSLDVLHDVNVAGSTYNIQDKSDRNFKAWKKSQKRFKEGENIKRHKKMKHADRDKHNAYYNSLQ